MKTIILGIFTRLLSFLTAFTYGIAHEKKKQLKADVKILKRQRDNDVHSIDDAKRVHKRNK